MRHKCANKTLTANTNYNLFLLYNLSKSLIEHGRIKTTLTRAKALRSFIERQITVARNYEQRPQAIYNLLQSRFQSKKAVVNQLIELSKKYQDRPGGYTRVLKLGKRFGDNAEMALIEFV